jgi:hypothetical protein
MGTGGRRSFLAAMFSAAVFAQAPPAGSEPPKLRGQTLSGQSITLPDAAAGRVTMLAIGASKKAGDRTAPWKQHFLADFGSDPRATYYVAALLQSAPSLVRGMIRSAMRGGTPEAQRDHVLTSASDEAAWKKYLDIHDDSLPAILLLNESGHALWSYSGEFDAAHYDALKHAVNEAVAAR